MVWKVMDISFLCKRSFGQDGYRFEKGAMYEILDCTYGYVRVEKIKEYLNSFSVPLRDLLIHVAKKDLIILESRDFAIPIPGIENMNEHP